MDNSTDRPVLENARRAADETLARMVYDGRMTVDVAAAMATEGFTAATKLLADLRRGGVSVECITASYEGQLAEGRRANDAQKIVSAEFTLAVWDGMQRDLAERMGTENR